MDKIILRIPILYARYLIAAWLLAGYLIPKTIWGRLAAPRLFWAGVPQTDCLIITLVLYLGVWAIFRPKFNVLRCDVLLWGLVFVYGFLYASAALRQFPTGMAVRSAVFVLLPMATGLLAACLCGTAGSTARIISTLGAVQAVYVISDLIMGQGTFHSGSVPRAGGTFAQPTAIYIIMLVCLPIALSLVWNTKPVLMRVFWAGCTLLIFVALILTWYRGALLGVCVSLTWLSWRLLGRQAATFIALTLLSCLLVTLHVRSAGAVNQRSSEGSISSRHVLWQQGWETFRSHWLTGIGAGQLRLPVRSQLTCRTYVLHEPKNLLLLWLDELGVGGGVLLAFFVTGICLVIRQCRSAVATGVGAAWLGLLVAGFFDTPFGVDDRVYANALVGILLGATLLLPESLAVAGKPYEGQ